MDMNLFYGISLAFLVVHFIFASSTKSFVPTKLSYLGMVFSLILICTGKFLDSYLGI